MLSDSRLEPRVPRRASRHDDPDRLAALHRYAAIQPEWRQLAARMASGATQVTNTAASLVLLVGGTGVRVVASAGLEVDTSPRPLPAHPEVLLPDGFVQSSDARALQAVNAVLSHHPKAKPPAHAFLATMPIRSPDGQVLGCLCVLDPQVKLLNSAKVVALEHLVQSFEHELDLSLELRDLKFSASQVLAKDGTTRLERIIESSNEAIISETLEGIVTSWNASAERIFGYSAREAIGRNIAFIIPGGNKRNIRTHLARLAAGERIEPFETCRLHKDGFEVPVRVSLSPIFGADGRVIGASSFTMDISEHKHTKEVLIRTEARLRAVVTALPVMLFAVDFEGRFTLCEGRALNVLGLRQGQLFGDSIFEVFSQYPSLLEATRRAVSGETFTATLKLDDRVLECWFSPLREAGMLSGATAIATDITERARSEEQLSLLETSIAGISEGVIITDANLEASEPRILYTNPAFVRMTGYSSQELIGQTPDLLHGPDTDRTVLEPMWRVLAQGQSFSAEMVNYRRDGTPYTAEWRVTPVRNGAAQITHFVMIQQDITERKHVAQVLSKVAAMIQRATDGQAASVAPGPLGASEPASPIDLGQLDAQLGAVRSALEWDAGLQGRLEEVGGASALVQMLALAHADGALNLGGATLSLQGGRIVQVEHPTLSAAEAILDVFALEVGRFWFNTRRVPITPTVNFDPTALALEAARRMDESRRVPPRPELPLIPKGTSDSKGLIVLSNQRLALEFMAGVGGVQHFTARLESNSAWGKDKTVLYGQNLKIVVLNGTLNDLPPSLIAR